MVMKSDLGVYICTEANHNKDFSVEKSFTQPSSFIGGIFIVPICVMN